MDLILLFAVAGGALYLARRIQVRLRLSRAKHPSLAGHARISRRLAKQVPFYEYTDDEAFDLDGAASNVAARRREAFDRLAGKLGAKSPITVEQTAELESSISDMQFTNANRVPFQFRNRVRKAFRLGALADKTEGVKIRNLDGNWSYDVGGSYGVNLLGYHFYKDCIDRAVERVRDLGPVLGPYHPLIGENVDMIRQVSGLDEVSFHMSGTEAVMQAVRLARYHTKRSHLVMSTGAYHGWWDGVQPGVGHQRSLNDIYMLKDMSEDTLHVLMTRNDIACVLINPLQALHPNSSPSSDAMLINSKRNACFDKQAYADWLRQVREVCTARGIVLIFDEVFVGFRLGQGGAQEFFDVKADMVTYGKTIGGGLPIGVLAGRADLMKRYRDDRPADVSFARGTFNSHPYVMATTNEFLKVAVTVEFAEQAAAAEAIWNARTAEMNRRLEDAGVPVRVRNMSSIWMFVYSQPGRYNWMLQYYLRAEGLSLSWVGTGRFIFSHNYTDEDFDAVADRVVAAALAMREDDWWTVPEDVTNASIQKQVFREVIAKRFGRA